MDIEMPTASVTGKSGVLPNEKTTGRLVVTFVPVMARSTPVRRMNMAKVTFEALFGIDPNMLAHSPKSIPSSKFLASSSSKKGRTSRPVNRPNPDTQAIGEFTQAAGP
ncbi:MAG: hypothetical protein IPP83_12695 [Flavobacteriales bacterium]|nr:hypothetical protein [Flavobacteriales bacterium]